MAGSPVAVTSFSEFPPVLGKKFLDIQVTIECGFTLKCVRDMTRMYSQMHRREKYSAHSLIIWWVGPNDWVLVYEVVGSWFESSCSHLNFILRSYFEQGVPWHSGNYRVWIHFEMRTWHDKNIQSKGPWRQVLRTQLNHLVSLAKFLSVRLLTKWFWVRFQLQSLNFRLYGCVEPGVSWPQATINNGFTLKCVHDMTRTYSQIYHTDKYSEHSLIIWLVLQNGWVFV